MAALDQDKMVLSVPGDVDRAASEGCNLLIRDGGIDGVVIRLGRPFASIEIDGPEVRAGAAALDNRKRTSSSTPATEVSSSDTEP